MPLKREFPERLKLILGLQPAHSAAPVLVLPLFSHYNVSTPSVCTCRRNMPASQKLNCSSLPQLSTADRSAPIPHWPPTSPVGGLFHINFHFAFGTSCEKAGVCSLCCQIHCALPGKEGWWKNVLGHVFFFSLNQNQQVPNSQTASRDSFLLFLQSFIFVIEWQPFPIYNRLVVWCSNAITVSVCCVVS